MTALWFPHVVLLYSALNPWPTQRAGQGRQEREVPIQDASERDSLPFQGSATTSKSWDADPPFPRVPRALGSLAGLLHGPPAQFLRAFHVVGIGKSKTGPGLMLRGHWYQSEGGKWEGARSVHSHLLRMSLSPPRLPHHGNANRIQVFLIQSFFWNFSITDRTCQKKNESLQPTTCKNQ